MPTVVDPEIKEKTNPAEAPIVEERELFADEVEMERKSSNLGPLIMVVALVAVVGGTILYLFTDRSAEAVSPGGDCVRQQHFEGAGRRPYPFQHRKRGFERG